MKANAQKSEGLSDADLDTVAGGALGCWNGAPNALVVGIGVIMVA